MQANQPKHKQPNKPKRLNQARQVLPEALQWGLCAGKWDSYCAECFSEPKLDKEENRRTILGSTMNYLVAALRVAIRQGRTAPTFFSDGPVHTCRTRSGRGYSSLWDCQSCRDKSPGLLLCAGAISGAIMFATHPALRNFENFYARQIRLRPSRYVPK